MNRTPRLTVAYKDKHDLFETFKKRMQELGIPARTVFFIDDDGEPVRLVSADTLMDAAKSSSTLRIYARDEGDEEEFSCSSCDELNRGRRPWKQQRGRRSRSHSRHRSRDHPRESRSHSRDRSTSGDSRRCHRHRHSSHHGPYLFSDYFTYPMTDSRFGLWQPFGYGARGGVGGHRGFVGRGGFGTRGAGRGRGLY
ncbi:hypothetical protein COOONC_22848 [Cooperia oncophora]